VARDRKRAKQRQRRQQAIQQRRPTERVPRIHETPTPDPLDHASADVDIARAAEHGVEPPGPDGTPDDALAAEDAVVYDDELVDVEPAPDEAEEFAEPEDLGELEAVDEADELEEPVARQPRRGAGGVPARAARTRPAEPREGFRLLNFLRACWAELQRVQWPDRRAVTQATGVVIGFVIIAGAFLGLADALWSRVVDAIL
jgi:preprotein translocase subunit SecE